jgi:alpha-glucosidase
MTTRVTRRDALKHIGTAGAGVVLGGAIVHGQAGDIVVDGKPVEIAIAALSAVTIRLTVRPLDGARAIGVPDDGALVPEAAGRLAARGRVPNEIHRVRGGEMLVRYTGDPPTLHVESLDGRTIQTLTFDAKARGLTFLPGAGPLLGLGQGGPQFDRKGSVDRMISGQAGYQLSTHGGRVPIQWLVSTDGWAMYIHQPLGGFDFTGPVAKFLPGVDLVPLDLFIVSSPDPAVATQACSATAHSCGRAMCGRGGRRCARTCRWR